MTTLTNTYEWSKYIAMGILAFFIEKAASHEIMKLPLSLKGESSSPNFLLPSNSSDLEANDIFSYFDRVNIFFSEKLPHF